MFDWLKKKKTPYEREMEMYEEGSDEPEEEEDDYFLYEMLEDD